MQSLCTKLLEVFFTCTLRFAEQRVKAVAPGEVKLDTHVVLHLPYRVIQRFEGCHQLSRSTLQILELQQHFTTFAGLFALITVTVARVLCAIESKRRRSRIRQTMACLRLFHALDYSKAWTHRRVVAVAVGNGRNHVVESANLRDTPCCCLRNLFIVLVADSQQLVCVKLGTIFFMSAVFTFYSNDVWKYSLYFVKFHVFAYLCGKLELEES